MKSPIVSGSVACGTSLPSELFMRRKQKLNGEICETHVMYLLSFLSAAMFPSNSNQTQPNQSENDNDNIINKTLNLIIKSMSEMERNVATKQKKKSVTRWNLYASFAVRTRGRAPTNVLSTCVLFRTRM